MTRDALRSAVLFDVDRTFIQDNLSEVLVEALTDRGVLDEAIRVDIRTHRIRYNERTGTWTDCSEQIIAAYRDKKCLKGLHTQVVKEIAREAIRAHGNKVNIFNRELMRVARSAGYFIAFISGSPLAIVSPLAKKHRAHACHGARFQEQDGVYTGEPMNWGETKDVTILRFAEKYNLDLGRSVAIGDEPRDARMFGYVGFPIMFNPDPELHRMNIEEGSPWPTVVEQQMLYVFKGRRGESRSIVQLSEILPEDIAQPLTVRLRKLKLLL